MEINYLDKKSIQTAFPHNKNDKLLSNLEKEYVIPKDNYKMAYNGIIKGLISTYISEYVKIDPSQTTDASNPTALYNETENMK